MHSRAVDEGHLSHAYDAHSRAASHAPHNLLEAVGDAEEEGAVDFIDLAAVGNLEVFEVGGFEVHLRGGVYFIGEHADLCGLGHSSHAEQAGEHQSHLDGHREVEDDGEQEGDEQHADIRLGVLQQLAEGAPATHVVCHDDQHACQASHGDILSVGHENEEDKQQHDGMNDAGDRCAAAVVDIRHRAGDGSRSGDSAEDGTDEVGHTLSNEFLVAVVAVADDTVGHRCREQRLDGTQHGNRQRGSKELAHDLPRELRNVGSRQRGIDAEAVADGVYVLRQSVVLQDEHAHRHQDYGHERAGNLVQRRGLAAHVFNAIQQGPAGDEHHTAHPDDGAPEVYAAEAAGIAHPLRHEVGRHRAIDGQAQQILHLGGENREGDAAGETHHNGIRNELDDGAEAKDT